MTFMFFGKFQTASTAQCCPNEDKSFMLHPCPKPSFIRFRGPHADALV